LLKGKKPPSVAIIEPSKLHFYQPGFTLVGGSLSTRDEYVRAQAEVNPKGATWIQDKVTSFKPEENKVSVGGEDISYKFLVVAPGMQLKLDAIEGLREALDDPDSGVGSIYSFDHLPKTAFLFWHENLPFEHKPFRAVFTQPTGPVKCPGAPQKIMYLAENFWRDSGVRWRTKVEFYTGLPVLFGHPEYAAPLNKICDERELTRFFQHDLTAIDSKKKEAHFQKTTGSQKENVKVKYDILHVVPKQGTGDFLKKSKLVDNDGFVDVDKHTLQHTKYANIFSLGDASNIPTSKTVSAISKQAPVVVANIQALRANKPLQAKYGGYTACPIVTSNHEVILAEFLGPGYGSQRRETFPFDQRKPRRSMFYLKRDFFPDIYFRGLIKGYWPLPGLSSIIGGLPKSVSKAPTPPTATPAKH